MSPRARAEAAVIELARRGGGRITPDQVTDAAKKDPRSPLHSFFNWDDTECGILYRREQARELIASIKVKIIINDTPVTSVWCVRDPHVKSGEQGYITTEILRKDKNYARDAYNVELSNVVSILKRAENLALLLGLHADYVKLINTVERHRAKVSKKT